MNPLAEELNEIIRKVNPHVYETLSRVGKNLFFPKGILSQSAEAKEKAHRFNATIGMATEKGRTMHLPSVMAMIQGLKPSESLTYAPSFGIKPLREAWKKEMVAKNPTLMEKTVSLPVVTHAITHGLSVVSDMWVDPGDVVILPDKMWGNYNMIFAVRRQAEIVHYPLFDDHGHFNIPAFKSCLHAEAEKRDKIIVILNFPNNPTGYTVTTREREQMVAALIDVARQGTNVLVLNDDAYFGLFYEKDVEKESLFSHLAGSDPRLTAIKLDGATKENYVWGLRVGFATYGAVAEGDPGPFYDALERKTAGAVRGSISNASHLGQSILYHAMMSDGYQQEKHEKLQIMTARANEVKRVLTDPKYQESWEPYPFNSGYFMCLKIKSVEAETLRVHLLDQYGIGLIALGQHDLRIAFSCIEEKDIQELFDTIDRGVKDLT